MAKYTSDASLIRGAGKAYRNLDNVSGMYAGLDKVIQVGTEMVDTAVKKAEEEKAKKEAQDKAWYDISGSVYENAGSFMKDVEYKDVANQISGLKERYIAAQESGNAEDMAAVQIEFNNIKGSVDDHKAFRETITDPQYGISKAMDNSGVDGGNNGEDKAFMTKLIAEDYTISKNKDGDKVYTIDGVSKTMKEIKDMAILKDNVPYAAYAEASTKYSKLKEFNRDNVAYDVRNNIVPQEPGKLRAFLADDGFGNGKNFKALLNDSKNKASIKKEISSAFDTDGAVGISDDEYNNFVEAIVDPRHKFWENNGGEAAWQESSSRIATEQLTNGIENRWGAIDRERNNKGRTGSEYRNYTVDGYTGINYQTGKAQYDNMLVAGKENYDRKGDYKYVSNGKGLTEVFAQGDDAKYKYVETIPTNDALARRGLDLFGSGVEVEKMSFTKFNPTDDKKDTDGDGIPDVIDPSPNKSNKAK